MTDFVDRRAVRTKGVVSWSLVKWILWLILLNISISEVVAEWRNMLMMHCWEASTEEKDWRSGAVEVVWCLSARWWIYGLRSGFFAVNWRLTGCQWQKWRNCLCKSQMPSRHWHNQKCSMQAVTSSDKKALMSWYTVAIWSGNPMCSSACKLPKKKKSQWSRSREIWMLEKIKNRVILNGQGLAFSNATRFLVFWP